MRVVEIGCGRQAGPFFEGAAEHFIVDTNADAVGQAYLADPSLTPMVASAANLEFDDASVDTVLARNVFGDSGLFLDSFQKSVQVAIMEKLKAEDRYEEIAKQLMRIEAESGLLKGDIMREAARILIPNGKLVVVEELSPEVARRFFESAGDFTGFNTDFDLDATFEIEHGVPLAEVTPPNYARTHGTPDTETWVATRK